MLLESSNQTFSAGRLWPGCPWSWKFGIWKQGPFPDVPNRAQTEPGVTTGTPENQNLEVFGGEIFNDPDGNPWLLFFGTGRLIRVEKATCHTGSPQILGSHPCFLRTPNEGSALICTSSQLITQEGLESSRAAIPGGFLQVFSRFSPQKLTCKRPC